jgi:hypothetical protein
VLLDDDPDEAKGASGDVDVNTRRIEQDARLYDTFATSEPALAPTESVDASGPWSTPGFGSCEQGVPSAPAQDQPRILPPSSTQLQDQINQQDIGDITQGTSVESAPHSLPKPSDNGDGGWTEDRMAELEREVRLALVDQVQSTSARAPNSPRPCSVEASQDRIQSRECTETTGSRPETPRDASRPGTPAQGHEDWEQRETRVVETPGKSEPRGEELVVEAGGVAMQQEELEGQKEELVAVGDQQDLVVINDTDDPKDKEATEALPAAQLEIDKHRFRLRGIRARQLAGPHTKTTQYRVVWGKHPNRYDSWVSEDDMQMSMAPPPCERSSQDCIPQVERDVMRVHHMRCSRRSKDRKVFEYLVDELCTWITEDQLRISLSSTLLSELRGK